MAERVYYGTCKTGAAASEKKVYVPDLDLAKQDFEFQEGDLLTVFFADTNTDNTPSIVVYNQDPEQENSTTSDEGKYIKSLDVEANMKDAWAAGETVIFAYTQQSTSNAYYWELIDAARATENTYGNTKLFDEDNLNDLLNGTYDGETDIALTPVTLKNFFDLLTTGQDEEEEEPTIPIGLKWIPSIDEGDLDDLGTLSLTNSVDGVIISYPLRQTIEECVGTQIVTTITHTGQLTNNGNGGGEGHETEASEPFITRIIPENLYFGNERGLYYGVPSTDSEQEQEQEPTAYPRIILNKIFNNPEEQGGTQNWLVIGDTEDTSLNGVKINKPLEVNGNEQVNGELRANYIESSGNVKAVSNVIGTVLYEDLKGTSTPIRQIYSPQIQVVSINCPTKTIDEGKSSGHIEINIERTGWIPIGVVGYNVNFKGEKSGDAAYANVWECCVKNNTTLRYAIRNLRNAPITINIAVDILYIKQLS